MNTEQSCCTPASVKEEANVQFYTPRYQISSKDDRSEVVVELPGVSKEQLQISIEDSELRIEASAVSQLSESWKPLHRESIDRSFRLRLRLGKQVDQTAISADLEDGVLTLILPRAEELKPREIKVR